MGWLGVRGGASGVCEVYVRVCCLLSGGVSMSVRGGAGYSLDSKVHNYPYPFTHNTFLSSCFILSLYLSLHLTLSFSLSPSLSLSLSRSPTQLSADVQAVFKGFDTYSTGTLRTVQYVIMDTFFPP